MAFSWGACYTRFYALFIALGMLLFGTMNTIFTKYQDHQSFSCNENYQCTVCEESENATVSAFFYPPVQIDKDYAYDETCIHFEQPVYQTFVMFVGELCCFFAYYISVFYQKWKNGSYEETSKLHGWKKLLFVAPTLCDMTATTLMNLGLIWTYASIFQMLRGAVVIFTGILSIIFLKRKQYIYHWLGMILVVAGVGIVGLSSIIFSEGDQDSKVYGVILILVAQIFSASQFIIEEKYLAKYEVPALQAVGYEGLFGVGILVVLMPLFQFAISPAFNQMGNFFDLKFAFTAFVQFPSITVSSIGSICSISMFNFFGLTITKVMSATARSTIDALRTLSVWAFGLIVGWEEFIWLQVVGFAILVLGTFTYNKIFKYPCFNYEHGETEGKPLNSYTQIDTESSDSESERKPNEVTYGAIN